MWNDAIERELAPGDLVLRVDDSEMQIKNGEFLDIYATNYYKQRQLQKAVELFQRGEFRDGDVFYIPDIFYPGIEALRYMADLGGIAICIATFNHAGRADKDDFVQNLGRWADAQEAAWHELSDLVMTGSWYQANRVLRYFPGSRVEVVGAVWDKRWMDEATLEINATEKEEFVIWPHRPCREKRYELLLKIAAANPELRFVITSGGPARLDHRKLPNNIEYRANLTKKQYFEIFSRAKYFLSTAYQETFGYTIQEAIYFGAQIICPDYACYREYVHPDSILPFEEMTHPGLLTKMYRAGGLDKSTQFPDNAAKIVKLIRNI